MRENGSLNFYRNLMKRDVPVDRNKTAPKCRQCCYYHPDFKYRKCLFSTCPYDERKKRTEFPEKANFRDVICKKIDEILSRKPQDMNAFLEELRTAGYEIKTGAHIAVKGML